jgi:hypothetical protein
MKIVGYLHVCQTSDKWTVSFDTLWTEIEISGLLEASDEIRVCVVGEKLTEDERFKNPKIRLFFLGHQSQYERPTLLHMRALSEEEDAAYFYLHTKGLRHYNNLRFENVQAWIDVLVHANITRWRDAFEIIATNKADTYGCLFNYLHYHGNFWWASSDHIRSLPKNIGPDYGAPEWWVTDKQFIRIADEFKYYGDAYKHFPKLGDNKILIHRKIFIRSLILVGLFLFCFLYRYYTHAYFLGIGLGASLLT